MPRKDTPRLGMAYGWLRGEDFWGGPTSTNRVLHDALFHPAPISMTLTEPPEVVEDGDQYIVALGGTGPWDGFDNHLAMVVEGQWFFAPLFYGLRVRVRDLETFFFWNGDEWEPEPVSGAPGPELGTRYDVSISVGYAPEPGEALLVLPIVQSMILPAGGAGSLATIIAPPAAGVQLSIMRNGSQVGTVVFSSSSFSGILNIPSNITFAPGDRLRVVCPPTLPENFKEFGIVLRMSLQ